MEKIREAARNAKPAGGWLVGRVAGGVGGGNAAVLPRSPEPVRMEYRPEPRVCHMCGHCWIAKRTLRRSDRPVCPNCSVTQSDDLTVAELDEMKMQYKEFKRSRQAVLNEKMAQASKERSDAQGAAGDVADAPLNQLAKKPSCA